MKGATKVILNKILTEHKKNQRKKGDHTFFYTNNLRAASSTWLGESEK